MNKILLFSFSKIVVLLFASVYLWTVPFYYWNIAVPYGLVDFLLPFEVVLSVVVSGVLLGWVFHIVLSVVRVSEVKLL